jgi:hypothetical protein
MHEGGDGVERIEKEVRIKLGLERAKFRLGKTFFEFGGCQFAFAEFTGVLEGVADCENDPVNPEVQVKRFNKEADEIAGKIGSRTVNGAFDLGEAGTEHNPEAGEENTRKEVQESGGGPVIAMKLEASRQAEHRNGENGEGIPVGQGGENRFAPGDLLGQVEVRRERERDGRPKQDQNGRAKSVCNDVWAIHKFVDRVD